MRPFAIPIQEAHWRYPTSPFYYIPFRFFSRQVRAAQDVIFSPKDPLPFFLQALSLLEISYLKFSQNTTWLEATTGDIEYNGEALT